MRTEEEIREKMAECNTVASWDISDGPCPFNADGSEGCCAECSTLSTLAWVLGDTEKPNRNAQDVMINTFSYTHDL